METLLAPFKVGYHITDPPSTHHGRRGDRYVENQREHTTERTNNQQPNNDCDLQPETIDQQTLLESHLTDVTIDTEELYDVNVNSDSRNSFRQDGFISTLTLFFIFLAVTWSVSAVRWVTLDQSVRVEDVDVNFVLVIYMLIACVCMWTLNSWKSDPKRRKYILIEPEERPATLRGLSRPRANSIGKKVQQVIQSSIPLMGIVVFFTMGLVLDIYNIVYHVSCMKAYYICRLMFPYIILLILHVLRMIFEGTLIAFAFSFNKKVFRRTCAVRYSLLAILAAILAIWFDYVLMFTRHTFPERYRNDYPKCSNDSNILDLDVDSWERQCMSHNSTMFQSLENISPYFYPMHIEYALIVFEIIYHMYSSTDTIAKDTVEAEHLLFPCRSPSLDGSTSEVEDSQDTPLTQSAAEILVSAQLRRVFSGSLPKSFTLCIIVNLVLITLATLTKLDQTEDTGIYTWHLIYESYKASYFFILCAVCLLGFHFSKNAISRFCNYSSLELLVIAATISYFLHGTFDFLSTIMYIAGTRESSDSFVAGCIQAQSLNISLSSDSYTEDRPPIPMSLAVVTLVRGVGNFSQFFLQITFTMHVSRLKIPGTTARAIVKELVLILAVSNLGLWIIDSFVELEEMFPISQFYYETIVWNVVSSILTPLFMFVRFNCFFILLNAYFSLRDFR